MISCCGKSPIWVENIPGKGYNFCEECRKEVLTPQTVEISSNEGPIAWPSDYDNIPLNWPPDDDQYSFMISMLKNDFTEEELIELMKGLP